MHEKQPFIQETPKTTQTIAIALGYLPELEGKPPLLKTPEIQTQDLEEWS